MSLDNSDNRIHTESIRAEKVECRRLAKGLLAETDAAYRAEASAAICDTLLAMDEFRNAKTIFAYSSVGREVSTDRILDAILDSGKELCLPRCTDIGGDGRRIAGVPKMEARYVSDLSLLETGAYGIREPDDRTDDEGRQVFPLAEAMDIDLVVLPCIACDSDCNRIGHGAGYYDRFLSELRDDCVKIAICFDKLILDHIPMEEHDMSVQAVISEKAVYRWRG